MVRRGLIALAAAAFLVLASQPPLAAQPLVGADEAILAEAGIAFPERLGILVRTQVRSGRDQIAASYVLPGADPQAAWVDIYIVRVGRPLAEEFAVTEHIIAQIHQNLAILRDLAGPPGVAGVMGRLWRGEVQGRAVLTGFVLWHHGGWRIKVRGTAAAPHGAWPEIERLIRELRAADADQASAQAGSMPPRVRHINAA